MSREKRNMNLEWEKPSRSPFDSFKEEKITRQGLSPEPKANHSFIAMGGQTASVGRPLTGISPEKPKIPFLPKCPPRRGKRDCSFRAEGCAQGKAS